MLLHGWKEIASYMRRGVRTMQRWEKLGLPVRRPARILRTPVLAKTEELDAWLLQASPRSQTFVAELQSRVRQLERENAELRRELMRLTNLSRLPEIPRKNRPTAA